MVFIPTYLYIKRHSITGKLYFGKTIQDPEKYLGSGTHWVRHLKVHGKHIETLWFCLFYSKESIQEFALNFSREQNIIESDQWLNLKDENGLDGWIQGTKHSKISRSKISTSLKGKIPHNKGKTTPIETCDKISDSLKGRSSPNKGKTTSNETKLKLSLSLRNRIVSLETRSKLSNSHTKEIVKCPHCDKIGNLRNMKPYHFDNCKFL